MNRSLKLSMLVALALGSNQAFAMELGQIQVKSALGQPLLAEIPLSQTSPAETKNLSVQLASSEEFARAGIIGGRTSIPLRFSVANTGAGHQVIRITSSVPVDDPYLDLLVEINGDGGKSVREFAILLDPPHSPMAAPSRAPVSSSPSQRAASRKTPIPSRGSVAAPVPAPVPAPVAAKPVSQSSVVNGKYGPVERGQTLSGVARSTAPAGVGVQQMMLALQQANPDAFYRENINALKSGAVLRVPTVDEAKAMTVVAALAEVRRQNSDWRAGTPGKPSVVADTATRAPAASSDGDVSDLGDRLALVPAKDGAGGAGAGRGNASGKSASDAGQDLMRAKESVVSLQQQSAELKSRLSELTDINSKNERLLSLKDSEIAQLQSKLAAARKAAGLPAAAPVAATPASTPASAASTDNASVLAGTLLDTATTGSSANSQQVPISSSSSIIAGTAMTPAASAPAPVAVPPVATEPKQKPVAAQSAAATPAVEQPWYMQTWAWAAGAGAVVVLVLLATLGRRRKGPAGSVSSKASLADRFGSAPAVDPDLAGQEDIDQDELLDQLAEHPDDIGLHLELVTLYYSRRDIEHFEAAAEAMYAHITDPQQDEWQDVLHMGEDLVPEHPLFDHHPELPASEEAEARREFDIDDYANDSGVPATDFPVDSSISPDGPKNVGGYNFNFDLTRPGADETPSDAAAFADDETMMPPLMSDAPEADAPIESESSWQFDDAVSAPVGDSGAELGEFSDDPIDTKLDLARAYLDMGDADGARAMLGEVMKEGSQMQRDTAKSLFDNMN